MRGTFLPFHRPSIGDDEVQEVVEVLRSGWITTGPRTKRFEKEFAAYVGSPHAVGVNSGTAALHLALAAIGLEAGDEVIVPTNTFTATAEVVTYFGGRPVLIDCRRDTFNMDETALEQRITSRTRALIPVHIAGQPCELGTILAISQKHGLKVIEDAAHALPARFDGKMIGTVGDITCFSFYATKNITTGEGGMATTADAEYADRMRTMSLHGISGDAWDRYQAEGSWYYEVVDAGFKYNMSDIAAAIGIHQLRNVESFWKRRCEIASRYTRNLADLEAVGVPAVQPLVQHAWHLYIILLSLENLAIDRAQFIEAMKRRNIGTSVHFIPLHMHPYYRKMLDYGPDDFPNAEWVYRRCISLPIYPGMSDRDVDDVTEAVWDIARRHRR